MTTNDPSTSTAVAEHEAGRLDQAEAIYRARLSQHPDDLATLIGLGDVLTDSGQLTEAEQFYRKAIELAPDAELTAGAYDGLAAIRQDMGDLDGAIPASKKAAVLRRSADDSFGVGNSLEFLGRKNDAIEMFVLATQQKANFGQAHIKAAQALLAAGREAEAIPHYIAAIELHPDIAELHCNLANARRRVGELTEALNSCRRAIELKPALAEAHNVMGAIWKDRRRPSDALESYKRALALNPNFADPLTNMAEVMEQAGQVDAATPLFQQAVDLQPNSIECHENLAGNLLIRGLYEAGWREYDWRRLKPSNMGSRIYSQPMWDGSPLEGRTIIVYGEQGYGDVIQFLRFIPLLVQSGGKVIVECRKELADLARTVNGVADVIITGDTWPECHVQCALMSLPMLMHIGLDALPRQVPYVSADPTKVALWKTKLQAASGKRVGIAWAGNPRHRRDKVRSIPGSRLAPLAEVANVSFVSLQKEGLTPPEKLNLLDLTADLSVFSDTAALIENLDLVLTVDTAIAHLAGALGKPVWVMLPAFPDWRWMLDRQDSPWYPSARLFRQDANSSWTDVIQRVKEALSTL